MRGHDCSDGVDGIGDPGATNGAILRLYLAPAEVTLAEGAELALPERAARHVQVRRLQPGDALRLFDGGGSDWPSEVVAMGRREVRVRVAAPQAVARELPIAVTLACGMPANERMDALVEKATELGVAAIQPLLCERAVLRLEGERAARRRAHWEAVAVAACEQCGRARLPVVHPVVSLPTWLAAPAPASALRIVLSTHGIALPLARLVPINPQRAAVEEAMERAERHEAERAEVLEAPGAGAGSMQAASDRRCAVVVLSGPEGGLSATELAAARAAGFGAASLGPRVLRADTAPLAALAWLALAGASGAGVSSAVGGASAAGTAVGASDAGTLRDAGSW